jgi:hypothetical protein
MVSENLSLIHGPIYSFHRQNVRELSLLLELEYTHPQGTSEIYKKNVKTVAPLAAGFSTSHLSTSISALAAQDNVGSE